MGPDKSMRCIDNQYFTFFYFCDKVMMNFYAQEDGYEKNPCDFGL